MKPEGKGGSMKLLNVVTMLCFLGTFHSMFSDFSYDDDFYDLDNYKYENKIIGISEFDTLSSKKIIINFEKPNPVCTYSPDSYKESTDDTFYRAFMPNTDISDDIQTSLDLDVYDSGVEIIFRGKSIKKFIGQFNIIFIVTK